MKILAYHFINQTFRGEGSRSFNEIHIVKCIPQEVERFFRRARLQVRETIVGKARIYRRV